jgi:hypothetical protein
VAGGIGAGAGRGGFRDRAKSRGEVQVARKNEKSASETFARS